MKRLGAPPAALCTWNISPCLCVVCLLCLACFFVFPNHVFLCLPFCLVRTYSVPTASISLSCVPSGPLSFLQIHHHVYHLSAKLYGPDMPCSHVVTAFRLFVSNRAVNRLGNPKNNSPCPISTFQCDLKPPRHLETCSLLGCKRESIRHKLTSKQ
jgi:hypothetical protein